MQARLQRFFPKTGAYPVVHRNIYNVHQRVAASFRKGRVFPRRRCRPRQQSARRARPEFRNPRRDRAVHAAGPRHPRRGAPDILDFYDRFRRPLNVEYVQQQTIANKKRLEEKDPAARARSNAALRATAADPAAHRAYLLRASLIDSVRKRQAETV